MKKYKLFYLLASLDDKSRLRFQTTISKTDNKQQATLINYISNKINNKQPSDYPNLRTKALRKAFENQQSSPQKEKRLISKTSQLLTAFILHNELNQQPEIQQKLLASYYFKNGLHEFYKSSLSTTEKLLNDKEERGAAFHQKMAALRHNFYFNVVENKYRKRDLMKDLKLINQELDTSYLLAKLYYACHMKMIVLLREETLEIDQLEEIIRRAELDQYKQHLVIQFYLNFWHHLTTKKETDYYKLKDDFFIIKDKMSNENRLLTFGMLINTCWGFINKLEVVYELYQQGLKHDVLLFDNKINPDHFMNIVEIGIGLNKIEETRIFVRENISHLIIEGESQANIKMLYDAFLEFGAKNYETVIQLLNYMEFADFSYGFRAYTKLIKSLYETKSYHVMDTRCNTFKQYILRKYKQGYINQEKREENLNFIIIVRQLPYASNSQFATVSKAEMNEKLKAMQRVISRAWLEEKISAL